MCRKGVLMSIIKTKKLSQYLFFLILTIILFNCSHEKDQAPLDFEEEILVRIGDRTISVSEFIKRAEYTPRPTYCNMNYPVHKKIILNSLVAEKLLAMEAGLDTAKILDNEFVNDYLDGIKEQAMRQILQYQEGHQKVKEVDTSLVLKMAKNMNIEYEVRYINLDNREQALKLLEKAKKVGLQEAASELFNIDKLNERFVKWHEKENDQIIHALFTERHKKGELIGPLQTGKSNYFFMEIKNWRGNVAFNSDETSRTYGRAIDYKTMRKADAYYTGYVRNIMKGKNLEFDPDIFHKMLNIMAPIYLQTAQKNNVMKNLFHDTREREVRIHNSFDKLKDIMDEDFFQFDGKKWTVKDFFKYRRSHPLVFRDKQLSKRNFPQKFKMAVVDMMTDYVLTEEAYSRGYDQVDIVDRHYNMWKDNLVSDHYKNRYIIENGFDSLYVKDQLAAFEKHMNPYINKLQEKYSDQIEFNKEAFMGIELNRIPMSVYKPLSPFPIVVPGFPVITNADKLDYGQLMNQ